MPEVSPSKLTVASTVGFRSTTALAVTLLKKALLNILPEPVLLLLCQSVISLVFIFVGSILNLYSPPKLDYGFVKGILPILAMKIIAHLSKTYCLLVRNFSHGDYRELSGKEMLTTIWLFTM
jgi:hypothetical protein